MAFLRNSKTELLIQGFVSRPTSTLIIEGSDDFGLHDCLDDIYSLLMGEKYRAHLIVIDCKEQKDEGIDVVRDLKRRMATIAGRDRSVSRIVTLLRAGYLSHPAQNALLKLIEEPSKNTLLIITTENRNNLIQTIRSRCQSIALLPITENQAMSYAGDNDTSNELAQKYFLLSQGATTLYIDLIHGRDSNMIRKLESTKKYIVSSPFERLQLQKNYSKPEDLKEFARLLQRLFEAGLHSGHSTVRWQKGLIEIRRALDLLDKNGNTKLVFLRLCIMV